MSCEHITAFHLIIVIFESGFFSPVIRSRACFLNGQWAMGLVEARQESTMNEILPGLHTEIQTHVEVKSKIQGAMKKFNSRNKAA